MVRCISTSIIEKFLDLGMKSFFLQMNKYFHSDVRANTDLFEFVNPCNS